MITIFKYINVQEQIWGKEIQLNRPEKLNALNTQMVDELYQALEAEMKSPTSILLVKGNGPSFCTGQDVQEKPPNYIKELQKYTEQMQKITELIVSYPFPVVAQVQGYALGAGCEIALNADLIYATENATFGFPELKVGLSITQGSSYFLPRLVGLPKAKEWIFFSKTINAKEMYEHQAINELFTEKEIEKEIEKRLTYLNKMNRASLSSIKKLFHQGLENTLLKQLQLEKEEIQKLIVNGQEGNDDKRVEHNT